MASKMYPLGIELILEAPYDIEDGNVKFALTTTTYNSAHDLYADVSASTVGTPIALDTPAITVAGTTLKFDATDTGLTWNAVAAGSTITGVIAYYDGATKPLIAFLDCTDTATNGGNITVEINASGVFTIDMS